MLKIYTVVSYVSVDGAKWRSVGQVGHCCTDEDRDVKFFLDNASFAEAREYLSNNFLDGVYNSETFWRSKPTIAVYYRDAWDGVAYKNFKTISYKNVYEEDKYVTLEWIMKHLSSEKAIQYLKERGITTCPMNF